MATNSKKRKISRLPYTGGAEVDTTPKYTGGATIQKLPNTEQQGYGGSLTGVNANPQVIGQKEIAPGVLYALTGRASDVSPRSSRGSSTVKTSGSAAAKTYGTDRPAYTPKYQGYIDELLGGIKDYGEYQSPYADRIENALGQIEGYGPYVSPYADRIDDMLGQIEGYGPYQSQYADQIAAQLAAIQNRDPFSYDLESDPAWQAYKQQYTREGRRASEDAMGQYAAMTGGMPSTAAMAAAQQAGNYYAAQMNDKIPELYKLAYDMYNNEGNQMMNQLSMLQGLDQTDYGRWADAYNRMLNGYDALRAADQTEYGRYGDEYNRMLQELSTLQGMDETQYGRWADAYNRMLTDMDAYRTMENDAYGRYRDTVSDWENDRDFAYNAEQDAWEQAYKERAYEDSRADADWEREYQERAYQDSRADSDWEKEYKERAYNDERADTEYKRQKETEASTIYAYSSTGGEPYTISSGKGLAFVSDAMPGDTMTGGDGSLWTKNMDGSVTISKDGQTWKISVPEIAASIGGYYGGGGGDGEDEGEDYPVNMGDVNALGYGPISADNLWQKVNSGEVEAWVENGTWRFRRKKEEVDVPNVIDTITNRDLRLGLF